MKPDPSALTCTFASHFTSIVVPLDLGSADEDAINVAISLGNSLGNSLGDSTGLPIEFVVVLSPTAPSSIGDARLRERVRVHGLIGCQTLVLHGERPASVLAEHLRLRPTALSVVASHARSAFGELIEPSTTARLMSQIDAPVVVVGPHVPATWNGRGTRLLVCVDPIDGLPDTAVDAVATWQRTFGGEPLLFEVVRPAAGDRPLDVDEARAVRDASSRLADAGVVTSWDVATGWDPLAIVTQYSWGSPHAVLAVASDHWRSSSQLHPGSFGRRLAAHAHVPILVMPVRSKLAPDRMASIGDS